MDAIYNWVLGFVTPFVKWWGKMHVPFTHKKVNGKHYYLLRDKIEVGTVLLSTTDGEFSNLINPEKIKHAAIYVGSIHDDDIRYVVEATGKGVVATDLVTFMTTKDLVIGCKPDYLTEKDKAALPFEAFKLIGTPYDYLFNKDSENLYCFELIAYCLRMVRPEVLLECKEIINGKFIYSYETFLDDEKRFSKVFDSRDIIE